MDHKKELSCFTLDGKEYQMLFTAEERETGKKYMVYTDGSVNEQGHTQLLFSICSENENGLTLIPLTADEQRKVIREALEYYLCETDDFH